MDRKTWSLIALVVAILFCGLPGLCGFCAGPIYTLVGLIPGSEIDIFGSSEPGAAITTGIVSLCTGVVLIAIPVLIWYFLVRKPSDETKVIEPTEEVPEDF
jgi:hypothetical protein